VGSAGVDLPKVVDETDIRLSFIHLIILSSFDIRMIFVQRAVKSTLKNLHTAPLNGGRVHAHCASA